MPQGLKPGNIKLNNRRAILRHLIRNGECTVMQIASSMGLSRTSVVKALGEFLQSGLIEEAGKGASTLEGGKRPELFRLVDDALYSLSVRINLADVVIEQRSLTAKKMCSCSLELKTPDDYQGVIRVISDGIVHMMQYYRIEPERLIGIVIGSDGVLDMEGGVIRTPAHHAWGENLHICRDIDERVCLEVPYYLGNMVLFAGYEQMRMHPDERLVLLLLAGISGSCVADPAINRTGGAFSELIHMIVDPTSGESCPVCGQNGCFHALISARRIRRLYAERSGMTHELQSEEIFRRADAGDAIAQELMDEAAMHFSVMVHNLAVAVQPQRIVIGDRFREPGEYLKEKLLGVVREHASTRFGQTMKLSFAGSFADFAPGAAWYATLRYLDTNT